MTTDRRPWAAALLSLPCPGMGHLYAGRPRAAIYAFLIPVAALAAFPLVALHFSLAPWNVVALWLIPIVTVLGIPIHAWYTAARAPKPYTLAPYNRWWVYLVVWLCSTALTDLLAKPILKKQWMEAFRIPAGSMEPTLEIGDFLYVDKTAGARRSAGRSGIVVFNSQEEPDLKVIKRIVGQGGDTIAMRHGELLLNGAVLSEPYARHSDIYKSENPEFRDKMRQWQLPYFVGPDSAAYHPDIQDWGPLRVPDSSFFVLGDNRDASYDSRYWGMLPAAAVLGQPRVIYWSYDPEASSALRFLTAVRWDRLGLRPR